MSLKFRIALLYKSSIILGFVFSWDAFSSVIMIRKFESFVPGNCFSLAYELSLQQQQQPGYGVNNKIFSEVKNHNLDFVYSIYEKIFQAHKRSAVFTQQFIDEIKESDKKAPDLSVGYAIKTDNSGNVVGALRAYTAKSQETLSKYNSGLITLTEEEKRQFATRPDSADRILPVQQKFPQLIGKFQNNKVELGRLATMPGTDRIQAMDEMAYGILKRDYPGDRGPLGMEYAYEGSFGSLYVYVHADSATMPLFRDRHGMKVIYGPDFLGAPDMYVLEIPAKDLVSRLEFLLKKENPQ